MISINEYLIKKGSTPTYKEESFVDALRDKFNSSIAAEYNTSTYKTICTTLDAIYAKEPAINDVINALLRLDFTFAEGLASDNKFYMSERLGKEVDIDKNTKIIICDYHYLSGITTCDFKLVNYSTCEMAWIFIGSNMRARIEVLPQCSFGNFCKEVRSTQLTNGTAHDHTKTILEADINLDTITKIVNTIENI